MMFWVRHALLVILCIILPFGAALYLDTGAELSRSREVGERAARVAKDALSTQIKLQAHESLEQVTQVARRVGRVPGLTRFEGASPALTEILQRAAQEGGFAWYVDPEGQVRARVGDDGQNVRSIRGRPSFVVTQRGISLDTIWLEDTQAYFVAASPVPVAGRAQGAVVIGQPVDVAWLESTAASTGADISLMLDGAVGASTLDPEARTAMQAALRTQDGARHFGAPDLSQQSFPFLPLLFDHEATGYSTSDINWQGDPRVSLQIAVHSGDRLDDLAPRQLTVLGAMAASLMLAILVGLINSRTFVHPLSVIEGHLSELQMGRGGAELPERKVSQPFRRVVRLINMTVQKIPTRGFGGAAVSSIDLRAPDGPSGLVSTGDEPTLAPPQPELPDSSGPLVPGQFSSGATSGPIATLGSADIQAIPATAAVPDDLPPEEPAPSPSAFDDPERTESAVAAALDSLTNQAPPRSANEIRGASPMAPSTADLSLADAAPDLGQSSGMPMDRPDDPARDATQVASTHHSTVVASVPEDLLAQAIDKQLGFEPPPPAEPEDEEKVHHREVFAQFVDLRRRFGEPTADLVFEKFEKKLKRNRDQLVEKYGCKTVRFQVYEKGGKAALKASPVR
ncbi:MAG: MXAN_5187 C-terminal domain-containing protein [Myxococcota bacterium]